MRLFKMKLADLTFEERLAHVALTWGAPLVCWDFFTLRKGFNPFAALVIVIGNIAGICAFALVEHLFFVLGRTRNEPRPVTAQPRQPRAKI